MRVAVEVVKFGLSGSHTSHAIVVAQNHVVANPLLFARHKDGLVPMGLGILEQGKQTIAVEPLRRRGKIQKLDQGGIEIHQGHGLVAECPFGETRTRDHKVYSCRVEPRLHFRPAFFLAQMITVVAPKDDIAALSMRACVPGVEDAANLFVGKTNASEVGLDLFPVIALGFEHLVITGTELSGGASDD